MVSVCPHGAAATTYPVDRCRDADREPLTSPDEAIRVVGFDERMDVICLHAEMENPKARVGGGGESAAHGVEHPAAAERRQSAGGSQRDVGRSADVVRRPGAIRNLTSVCAVAKRADGRGYLITAYPADKVKDGELVWKR